MVRAWQITQTENIELQLNAASLDEATRQIPDGYYSTFRTFNGCTRVLGLDAHLRRLYEPVSASEVDAAQLRRQLRALLEPYDPGEARVRVIMTHGGQVYIAIEPLKLLPREIYEQGVHVVTTELQRQHPRLKSTSFIGRSDPQRKHIAQEGIFEALLVKDGEILEGMTSNFFYVKYLRGEREREIVLGTAKDEILLGITRQTVIDLALAQGLEVNFQPLKRDQLSAVDETFITSSSRGIVPVVKIDDIIIGQGRPGPITKQLLEAYEPHVIKKAEEI